MITVVFYISGHGFGHASRQVEVMNALGDMASALGHPLRLIIRSAVSPSLLERTINVPYELRSGPCDTGVIQNNSVTNDEAATILAAAEFYSSMDARADREAEALAADRVQLIVGDIAPIAFEVAARLKVPSLLIGNFTWDWIYEHVPGMKARAPGVFGTIRAAQRKATAALRLPFAPSFDDTGLRHVRDLALIARRATKTRLQTRAHFDLPQNRRLALISFGGFGLNALNLANVDAFDEWDLVTTDRTVTELGRARLPRVHVLSETDLSSHDVRYEDLLASCDAVITKPGFGIIAECATNDTPMVYTSRGAFREYDLLVEQMPRYLRCAFLSQEDLFAGRWRAALEAATSAPPPPERLEPTGADDAARTILHALLG